MPTNAKRNAYKEKEFELYVIWKFLPAHFRGMQKSDVEKVGLSNPSILKIIKIKNQTDFAKTFRIKDLGTLTDWNNRIKKENISSPFLVSDLARQNSDVNLQALLPRIEKLRKRVANLNKQILLLKKENLQLKSKRRTIVQSPQVSIPKVIISPAPVTTEKKASLLQKLIFFFTS